MNILLEDEQATEQLGKKLQRILHSSQVNHFTLYLSGDLGAGKTTFVRGFIREWGYLDAIKSPTFSLVEPYESAQGKIFHFDLYRLKSFEELEHMGFRDYFATQAIKLIEWPEKAQEILPQPDCHITLSEYQEQRCASVKAFSPLGETVLASLCETA